MSRRTKPYTQTGIRRVPCYRGGQPSHCQWQICADDNTVRPLCMKCDVALNDCVLRFMRDPGRKEKIRKYRNRMAGKEWPCYAEDT
jgi:hypothetical protein